MSNHKAHFRGDIQVDGSIVGPDGQPVGGSSVDLTHLTELAFGEASDIRLSWADVGVLQLDSGQGETAYLYATNESELYADDLQEAWFYPGALDLADYRYDNLVRLRTSNDLAHGLYVSKPGQNVFYGPDGMRFNQVAGVPAASLLNTAPGTLEIDHTLSFAGADGDIYAGATLAWDDDLYGLVLKGRPGSNDSEIYIVNPDNDNDYVNIWAHGLDVALAPYGKTSLRVGVVTVRNQTNTHSAYINANDEGSSLTLDTEVSLVSHAPGFVEITGGDSLTGLVAHSPDGTAYKLTPPNGGGAATWVAA